MTHVYRYRGGQFDPDEIDVVEERPLALVVNGVELATLMVTPVQIDALVLGFLYFERVITKVDQIRSIDLDLEDAVADIELHIPFKRPDKRVITSGCTGGVSFQSGITGYSFVNSCTQLKPESVQPMIRALYASANLYRRSRGIHAAALAELSHADGDELLITAEDVGRHNAVDKIQGEALTRGLQTKGQVLLSTGRISSEMLRKGARMLTPFIISRTSPTSLAVEMAKRIGITLIGYVRNQAFNVYSHPHRINYVRSKRKRSDVEVVEVGGATTPGSS